MFRHHSITIKIKTFRFFSLTLRELVPPSFYYNKDQDTLFIIY